MSRMIIELEDGIVTGVYTDCMENYQVEITDTDDVYDLDRMADRQRLAYLINNGGFRNNLDEEEKQDETADIPCLNPDVFVLIAETAAAKTEIGRKLQMLDTAFLDGYLSASAKLSKFITRLFREKNPDASPIYKRLKPLIDQLDFDYNQICRQLNEKTYDEIGKDVEKKLC